MSLLSTLLFPGYRSKILGLLLLHPENRYHVREIARLTGTVAGSVHRELAKLAKAEILVKEVSGNQVYYSANRNCIIYEELASILRKTSGLAEVVANALLPLENKIAVALIFGSIASGTENEGSDIDLLIIGDIDFNEIITALYPTQAVLKREINPKLFTVDEWQKLVHNNSSFIQQILKKPKLFIAGDLNDIK
jgi:predicted nucleotidyltransferase